MRTVFEHTADLGLRIEAADREQLFSEAALGLFEIICGDLGQVRAVRESSFRVSGNDAAYLLFDWLNELLYAFETQRMLFSSFRVRFVAGGLDGVAAGEPYDPERHELAHEVKAITYHGLAVERTAAGWTATVIVDI